MKILATNAAKSFKCLQADCPDTCCKGWSMQLDDFTFTKYQGTNLEKAVSYDGDVRVMKRDPKTDYCIKFEDGICGIHKDFGAPMLGDACNFYPRVTRNMGEQTIMTLTPSCPEVARLMLENDSGEYSDLVTERLPSTVKNWVGSEISTADAMAIHKRFLAECKIEITASQLVARIYSVSTSLQYIGKVDWAGAANFMFRMADGKLPAPIKADTDNENILQVFLGILHATGKSRGVRVTAVLDAIANYLAVEINYTTLVLTPKIIATMQPQNPAIDDLLKKYIAMQLSFTTYPFAGTGENMQQKVRVLIFKFAFMHLALKAWGGNPVDCIQPISRIIDHLADAELMLKLMDGFGWNSEARLMGLIAE